MPYLFLDRSWWGATASRWAVGCVLSGVLAFGLLGACSDDDDDDSDDASSPSTDEPTTTATTQPPGTELEDVQPLIEELVVRLDDVTDQIVRDPTVVNDPDSELIEEFTALYAPEAEGLTGGLNAFQQSAEEGVQLEPLNAETTGRTEVTGELETVDENTVRLPVCNVQTYRALDSTGAVLEYIDGLAQPGQVWAVRVDGVWLLERADQFENTVCTAEVAPA